MLMVHSAMAAMTGAGLGLTPYERFVAHITALATNGEAPWGSLTFGAGNSAYVTTAGAGLAGNMLGSPWGELFYANVPIPRLMQHGLPSLSVLSDQQANGRKIFFRVSRVAGLHAFNAISRNGYTSRSSEDADVAARCTELIRWDGAQAWRSNPSIMDSETLYTGWIE